MEDFVKKIIVLMRKYQEDNNIDRACITNAQYLYSCIKRYYPYNDVKVSPVICMYNTDDRQTCCVVHLVVVCDGVLIEPSNEIYKIGDMIYVKKLAEIKQYDPNSNLTPECYKYLIIKFVEFIKISNNINNGIIQIHNKDYYNNQADYVDLFQPKC